jgi:hypothetical protein
MLQHVLLFLLPLFFSLYLLISHVPLVLLERLVLSLDSYLDDISMPSSCKLF